MDVHTTLTVQESPVRCTTETKMRTLYFVNLSSGKTEYVPTLFIHSAGKAGDNWSSIVHNGKPLFCGHFCYSRPKSAVV